MDLFFQTAAIRHLAAYRQGIWRAPYLMTDKEIFCLHRGALPEGDVKEFAKLFREAYDALCSKCRTTALLYDSGKEES